MNVVVREGIPILKLFASKDQPLLIWGNALLVLNLGLYTFDSVRGYNLKSDGFTSIGLDKNLHRTIFHHGKKSLKDKKNFVRNTKIFSSNLQLISKVLNSISLDTS